MKIWLLYYIERSSFELYPYLALIFVINFLNIRINFKRTITYCGNPKYFLVYECAAVPTSVNTKCQFTKPHIYAANLILKFIYTNYRKIQNS